MSKTVRTYGRRRQEAPPSRSLVYTPPPSSPSLPSSPTVMACDLSQEQEASSSSTVLHLSDAGFQQDIPRVLLGSRDCNIPEKKQSTLSAFFTSTKRKRPLTPPPSSPTALDTSESTANAGSSALPKKVKLTQLHFTQNSLRSCRDCGMSYVRGSDDAPHTKHHARVVRGIPCGSGKMYKDCKAVGQVGTTRLILVDLADGAKGRLDEIMTTVDTVLSAPALPDAIRSRCKLILAVTSEPPKAAPRDKLRKEDRVVGVVVAQPIKTAMRVLSDSEEISGMVDSGGGVVCDPTPLPTPLGIHRLFVVPAYRGTGIARAMLDAAARHTVYGCELDPTKGEVAFSQPTESGRAVMQSWGGGGVRVFVDDERQL